MGKETKTTEQRTHELAGLRQRGAELERPETKDSQAEELRVGEDLVRSVMENLFLGITVIDTDYKIRLANKAIGRYFNKPVSALIGHSCFDEFEKRESICPHCPGTRAIATGKPGVVETEGVRDDGSRFSVRIQAFPTVGSDGAVTGFIEVVEDITARKQAQKALRKSEARFRRLYESNVVGIAYWNLSGVILDANDAYLDTIGYTRQELVSRKIRWQDITPPEYAWLDEKGLQEVKATGTCTPFEKEYIRKDGIRVPILIGSACLEGEDEIGVSYVIDITERKRAEEALRESEAKYRSLVESTEDSVYLVDKDGAYLFMNKKYLSRIGCPVEEVVGSPYAKFHSEEKTREFLERLNEVLKTASSLHCEHRSERDGHYFLRTLSPVKDQNGQITAVMVLSKDITRLKQAEEQLAHMATHDPLTDLPNRQAFNDRLSLELFHAQRDQQKLAVLMLDLDDFKDVNDTLGHRVGDWLLRAVADRLKGLIRKSDTVARVGGDEFMLIVPEIASEKDAVNVAEKVLEAVRKSFVIDGRTLRITTSIGVAIYPHDSDDADGLVKNADIAMYRAKEAGRNTYKLHDERS